MRLEVVMMEMLAVRRQTRGKLGGVTVSVWLALLFSSGGGGEEGGGRRAETHTSRQIDPAWLLVALKKMARRGPAGSEMTSVISPATKSKQVRKMNPVLTPIKTQPIMILGPSTDALGISSIICATPS